MANKTSKTDRLVAALETGKNLTAEQLTKRTGLVNVASTINRLRDEGLPIFTNTKGAKGNRYSTYRMAV